MTAASPERDAARAGHHEQFLQVYSERLSTEEAQAHLAQAANIATESNACLLCYERDSNICHRKLVTEALSDMIRLEVRHLEVANGIAADDAQAENRGASGPC